MAHLSKIKIIVLILAWFGSIAYASPTIDSLNVQGFMKKANGTAVTDGTYTLAFGLFQNGSIIWGRSYSVTVTNGLFSRTISGVGGDLTALPGSTGMNFNFSATGLNATLNAALLTAGGAGGLSVRVYAVSAIDGNNPQFDISLAAVPTSLMCEAAKGVVAGSVTTAGIATGSKTNSSAGAGDAGKIPLLDAAGLIALNMIPSLPASQIGSGQIGIGNGGTGSTDGSITGTSNLTLQSAAGSTTTLGSNSGAATSVIRSGTGGIAATVTGTSGNIALTAGSTSGDVVLSSGSSGVVDVASGTGLRLTNGTGAVTLRSPLNPTSYVLTFPSSAGTANYFLQTNGSGTTSWAQAALAGSNTDITSMNPSSGLTLGGASTTSISMAPAGAVGIAPTAGGVTIAPGAGNVSISPTGNVSVIPTGTFSVTSAGDATISPTAGNVIVSPTGNVTSSPTGTMTLSPTGALTVGSTATTNAIFGNTGTGSSTTIRSGTGGILIAPNAAATASNVTISGGINTTGTSGSVTMNGGDANTATFGGGAATVRGGTGNTSGSGGALTLSGGTGGNAGAGGAVTISTGAAGGGNTAGGALSVSTGAGQGSGLAGAIDFTVGAAGTTSGTNGSSITLTAGASAATGAAAQAGSINLTAGNSTAGLGGNIIVTPGTGGTTKGVFRGTRAAYSGGTQAVSGTGGAYTIAADGSSMINFTVNTSNTTTATITGCNTNLYPQGAMLTVAIVAGGAFTWTVTDSPVGTATADQIVLNGNAVNYVTGAANGVGRGSTLTLICATIGATRLWLEVGRNVNAN